MNIAKDEMRHHVFYANALATRLEAAADRAWFEEMALDSFTSFKMPHVLYPEPLPIFDRTTMLDREDQRVLVNGMRRALGKIPAIDAILAGVARQLEAAA